jgi:hypothetical protein
VKVVWITCSILCAIGCLCGIGFIFTGRHLLQVSEKLDAEADRFASQVATSVCKTWDGAELQKFLSDKAAPGLTDKVLAQGKLLGPLQMVRPFVVETNGWFYDNGVKASRVKTTADAKFEHGAARLEITVMNRGAGWQVMDFQITPEREFPR